MTLNCVPRRLCKWARSQSRDRPDADSNSSPPNEVFTAPSRRRKILKTSASTQACKETSNGAATQHHYYGPVYNIHPPIQSVDTPGGRNFPTSATIYMTLPETKYGEAGHGFRYIVEFCPPETQAGARDITGGGTTRPTLDTNPRRSTKELQQPRRVQFEPDPLSGGHVNRSSRASRSKNSTDLPSESNPSIPGPSNFEGDYDLGDTSNPEELEREIEPPEPRYFDDTNRSTASSTPSVCDATVPASAQVLNSPNPIPNPNPEFLGRERQQSQQRSTPQSSPVPTAPGSQYSNTHLPTPESNSGHLKSEHQSPQRRPALNHPSSPILRPTKPAPQRPPTDPELLYSNASNPLPEYNLGHRQGGHHQPSKRQPWSNPQSPSIRTQLPGPPRSMTYPGATREPANFNTRSERTTEPAPQRPPTDLPEYNLGHRQGGHHQPSKRQPWSNPQSPILRPTELPGPPRSMSYPGPATREPANFNTRERTTEPAPQRPPTDPELLYYNASNSLPEYNLGHRQGGHHQPSKRQYWSNPQSPILRPAQLPGPPRSMTYPGATREPANFNTRVPLPEFNPGHYQLEMPRSTTAAEVIQN